jgi:hypothetical protein
LQTDSPFDILMVGDRYVRVVFRKPFKWPQGITRNTRRRTSRIITGSWGRLAYPMTFGTS